MTDSFVLARLPLLRALLLTLGGTASLLAPVAGQDVITVEGFSASEAVKHDTRADVYLVANINGEPTGADDNGFISRVAPDGSIDQLRWIDGTAGEFTLNAPKGMDFLGDLLLVADIDHVRAFDRTSGEYRNSWAIPDAAFLNDVTVRDGIVYVTDTGRNALWRIEGDTPSLVASGEAFGNPNGVDGDERGLAVVLWRGGAKRVNPSTGETMDLPAPEGAQLDGIVLLDDGSYIVSSWSQRGVLRVSADGEVTTVLGDTPQAADIAYDARRNRILVPTFENRLHIVPLGSN